MHIVVFYKGSMHLHASQVSCMYKIHSCTILTNNDYCLIFTYTLEASCTGLLPGKVISINQTMEYFMINLKRYTFCYFHRCYVVHVHEI